MWVCAKDTLIPHCKWDITASPGFWLFAGILALVMIVRWFEEGSGWLVLKWCARIALCLLMIPLAFLAWYMAAAIPVSIAILLGAGIIAVAVRSSSGRVSRRLTAQPQEAENPTAPAYRNYPHSISGE